jgi:hypothetical protein
VNNLPELQGAFDAVDAWIDQQVQGASAQPATTANTWHRRKLINQEAYFVLAWGQFELEIEEACREFIRRRQHNPNWEQRRAIDIYNPEDPRLAGLSLEERVALVVDKNSDDRREIVKYYQLRNLVAHGKSFATGIDFDQVVADLFSIYSRLSR